MKHLKYGFRSAFGFSRAQARGFVVLAILVLGFVFSGALYSPSRTAEDPDAVRILDSLLTCWNTAVADADAMTAQATIEIKGRPFRFDPNKLSIQELQRVGLPPTLAKRVVRYREAGGVFRSRQEGGAFRPEPGGHGPVEKDFWYWRQAGASDRSVSRKIGWICVYCAS